MTDFLGLEGRRFLVCGVANKKSVGFQTGKRLVEAGADVAWTVHTEERKEQLEGKLPGSGPTLVCDVERSEDVEALPTQLRDAGWDRLQGLVHSIAFANYAEGFKPFHETAPDDFLQAVRISCFSFVELSKAVKPLLADDASMVTISISTTRMASENYGYMAPVKAALDSSVAFLAKSFSADSRVRFNAVKAGLLKTSSSAGIPGYLESYLFAEQAILRKRGLQTGEVADTAVFLLSPRSSGINGQGIVVDAGMELNYFDRELVSRATRPDPE
ncbi:MAG: SDR family oxidoreductase [Planctomycetota bacterium]